MKVLVTGGAGFTGHRLVRGLLARSDEGSVIDDFSTRDQSRLVQFHGRITLTEGTILDPEALDEAVAGCDVVLHEAAIPSVARSLVTPRPTNDVPSREPSRSRSQRRGAARRGTAPHGTAFGGSSLPDRHPSMGSRRSCRVARASGPTRGPRAARVSSLRSSMSIRSASSTASTRSCCGTSTCSDRATTRRRTTRRWCHGPPRRSWTTTFQRSMEAARSPAISSVSTTLSRQTCWHPARRMPRRSRATSPAAPATAFLNCSRRSATRPPARSIRYSAPPRLGDLRHSVADISAARQELGHEVVVPFREGIALKVAWYRDQPARSTADSDHHSEGAA